MRKTHRAMLYRTLFAMMVGISLFAVTYPFATGHRLEHPLRTILTGIVGCSFLALIHLTMRKEK